VILDVASAKSARIGEEIMGDEMDTSARTRWARFRFGIIATLLSAPPADGELGAAIAQLAAKTWRHPTTGDVVHLSAKTIERWYYTARGQADPIVVLERKVPSHAGTHPSISAKVEESIRALRRDHPRWSFQLVYDNLHALGRQQSELAVLPGYATVCRFMKHHGLSRARRPRRHEQEPGFVARERRSFEVEYVHGLWHCDFHDGRRSVATSSGERAVPILFAMLDDRSRLCAHAQWYLGTERPEIFVHGLCQGLQKRGLPRALLSDNGGAMLAAESQTGLSRLSIEHYTTLAQTPEQNGKQEVFWSQVEGRLMAMLDGEKELTLDLLNRATQAWVEQEYHHAIHSETKQTPLLRWLAGPSVGRPCPSSDELRRAFRMEVSRAQRRSDGTITIAGVRYELSNAYRTLVRPTVRVTRWDLSCVELVDPHRGTHLATLFPADKQKNAERRRRALVDAAPTALAAAPVGIAPLLRQLMAEYAATGLPPAYVPHESSFNPEPDDEESKS
jgi:transposase InsO family protein